MLNNKYIKVYTVYNPDNTIKEKYVRKPSPLDGTEPVAPDENIHYPIAPTQMSQKPQELKMVYYGEWEQVPQKEIDKMNEKILATKISRQLSENRPAKRVTDYENKRALEIKQAEELLKALRAQEQENLNQKEVK